MTAPDAPRPTDALLRFLLAIAAGGVAAALLAAAGWYRTAHRPIRLENLQPSERQRLFEEMAAVTPGAFEPAWYEPRIGYTLKRDAELEIWDDKFRSNQLGYRTGPLAKRPGSYRILFLGDSWTYGMGVRESESFPRQLEDLVRGQGERFREVESWTLALPGYNLSNAIAAFELWEKGLAPDAVVVVPSSNDNESAPQVAPNGQLYTGAASLHDAFGEPHAVWHVFPWLFDGHRALERWRTTFDQVRRLELHLERRGVPLALLFVARWRAPIAHRFVAEAGIEAPYAVVPERLTLGEWLTKLPNAHGNARANFVYARILHRLLERPLGWPTLADSEPNSDAVPIFDGVPPPSTWAADAHRWLRMGTRRFVPESFEAGPDSLNAWSGPGDPATGIIGRATTLLVHPPAGTAQLEIRVRRLDELALIYPLGLEVTIPSPSGGTRVRTTVPADGPAEHRFRIAVPADRDGDQALEVVLVVDRVTSQPPAFVAQSLAILSIRSAD